MVYAGDNVWTSNGPEGGTGVGALAIDPLTRTTLYAGTGSGGVFAITFFRPICDIQMSQPSYVTGATVTAQVLRLANPGAAPLPIELKIWFEVPGVAPITFANVGADGSVVLAAGFEQNFGPRALFPVTAAFPRGFYAFNCRILAPVTGEVLAEDLTPFAIQ